MLEVLVQKWTMLSGEAIRPAGKGEGRTPAGTAPDWLLLAFSVMMSRPFCQLVTRGFPDWEERSAESSLRGLGLTQRA